MSNLGVRKPVVAGQFYPSSAKELRLQISKFVDKKPDKSSAIGCILPHAGYIYSGSVAARTLSLIDIPKTVVLLGPNHTGYGLPFSIWTEGAWQTPLGDVQINSGLARQLFKSSDLLKQDLLAHAHEHSLEVQLPLIQYFRCDVDIVPIVVSSDDISLLKGLGVNIAEVISNTGLGNSVLILASSDMTHYEPLSSAKEKDNAAIEAILRLDEDALMDKIKSLDISMCGYMPVIVMLAAVKRLGAKSARLVKYSTSADATGDASSVVGYAGIVII